MKAVRSIIFLLVCIGLIWLFVLLIVGAFKGSNTSTTSRPTEKLTRYATTDAVAEMYMDGPIVINEEHKAVRISVNRSESKIEIIAGYDGQVVDQRAYPNTEESYQNFLAALDTAGFTQGAAKDNEPKEQGVCPMGSRYVFRLLQGSETQRSWTTSCGGGNYSGNKSLVRQLFIKQIPDKEYYELTRTLRLNSI